MGKDFVKFMVLVVIIYLGFLTTFSLVGRDEYTFRHMAMVLTKIFFGSSPVGLDLMHQIDPIFGPPLMIIFVTLSSILLMGSLTGMLSNSFSRVITHAREEYLYVYSVYVLEASTSNRLTHFYPPFNLIALVVFRPLRLFLPSDDRVRAGRILLLKATHLPVVGVIMLYESARSRLHRGEESAGAFRGPQTGGAVVGVSWAAAPKRPEGSRLSSSFRGAPLLPPHSPRSGAVAVRRSDDDVVGVRDDKVQTDDAAGPLVTPTTPSGGVEGRIAGLEAKIDRLMELVVVLQARHERPVADAGTMSDGREG